MKRLILVFFACAVLAGVGFLQPVSAQREQVPPWRVPMPAARTTAEIVVGETPVTVDLALTPGEQHLGLGYRNGLAPGTGMLFVFPEPAVRVFVMRGMRFCLDIIWIANGAIVGAAEDLCPDPEGTDIADQVQVNSGVPVTHVLEMPAGWMAANGHGPGTIVRIADPLG